MNNSLSFVKFRRSSYIQNLKNIPLLSKDEEYLLARAYRDKNDIFSAKKLVESNLNYVVKIAKNYDGYGIIIKDLVQVGVLGLMKAVQKFDPEKKVRLISFAIYWIKSEMHEYILKNLKIVKIAKTKNQKKLFFNLKGLRKSGLLNDYEKKVISNLLNVKRKEIDYMELSLSKNDLSIDDQEDRPGSSLVRSIYYPNKNDPFVLLEDNEWLSHLSSKFRLAFKILDKRSQDIIKYRWLSKKKYTLKELGSIYNISSERIRQIEKSAFDKLKKKVDIEI